MLNPMIVSLLLIFGVSPSLSSMEEGYLELYVKSPTGAAIRNLAVTCQEQCNTSPSDNRGKVRLKLPPQIHSDDWVTLRIMKPARNVQWVLISPWDDRINVPSFSNKTKNITAVVVVPKGDKTILSTTNGLSTSMRRCWARITP